jgi:hypothetical protein
MVSTMSYLAKQAVSPKLALFKLTSDTSWVSDATLNLSLDTDVNLISESHCSLINGNTIRLNTGVYFFEFKGAGTRTASTAISLDIKKNGTIYTEGEQYTSSSYDAITDVKKTVKTVGLLKEIVNGTDDFTLVTTGTSASTTLLSNYTYLLIWRL